MTRGIVEQSEMLKLRTMVVELYDNLDKVILTCDKVAVQRYIRTTRSFTNAEAAHISTLHYNFQNPRRRNNGT